MSWFDNIDFSSTAEAVSDTASSGGFWNTAVEWGTKAFEWLEDHPTTANVLGGVATGAGTYLAQRDLAKKEADLQRELYQMKRNDQMITPGNVNNYGSHTGLLASGGISSGQIANYRGMRNKNGGM